MWVACYLEDISHTSHRGQRTQWKTLATSAGEYNNNNNDDNDDNNDDNNNNNNNNNPYTYKGVRVICLLSESERLLNQGKKK